MKVATSMTLAATIGAALALAQTRQMAMVKNSPTNYGTNGFDISLVDNSTQKYYLADRTNDAIDLVNAATDTLLGFIGKNQYTGARPCPGSPRDLRNCAGPNGVVTDNSGHVWPATAPATSLKPDDNGRHRHHSENRDRRQVSSRRSGI